MYILGLIFDEESIGDAKNASYRSKNTFINVLLYPYHIGLKCSDFTEKLEIRFFFIQIFGCTEFRPNKMEEDITSFKIELSCMFPIKFPK